MSGSDFRTEAPLDALSSAQLLLAAERVTSAQATLSLRQLELQVLVGQVRQHFEEEGRYVVHEVDPTSGVVRRSERSSDAVRRTNGAAEPSDTKQPRS